jgi:hypothetical protein
MSGANRRHCDCGARASHTAYDQHHTMTFLCDDCASQMIDEAAYDADQYDGVILVPSVEETDMERRKRLAAANVLGTQSRRPGRCKCGEWPVSEYGSICPSCVASGIR